MKCPVCGIENPDTAASCASCQVALDRTLYQPLDGRNTTTRLDPPAGAAVRQAILERTGQRDVHARFLLSPLLAGPVLLENGNFYRIGRDRGSDIWFPSSHVSRIHAEVCQEKKAWIVQDLGSRNGTFVNGERTLKRALKHGDRMSFGQFEITYFEATAEEARELLDRDRGKGDTRRLGPDAGEFYGDLDKISVVEVVQLLNHNRKTGVLSMRSGPDEWRVFFLEGAIVHGEGPGTAGEPAVERALRLRQGKFQFKPTTAVEKVSITTPTSALLLNAV